MPRVYVRKFDWDVDALTHCGECGRPFDVPVAIEDARKHWDGRVEIANYSCRACADAWTEPTESDL